METASEREQPERRIGPTVSKDKWVNHAKTKLGRGYVLIVGTERKTANFHSPEKGYEMCAYHVATQLVKEGALRKVREHPLGDVYELVPTEETASPQATRRKSRGADRGAASGTGGTDLGTGGDAEHDIALQLEALLEGLDSSENQAEAAEPA